jgi:flagellar protein FlbD
VAVGNHGWKKMIIVTRLGGHRFALNADLIERAEETPDTIVTLVDGTRYVLQESLDDLVEIILVFRASIVEMASRLDIRTMQSHEAQVLQLLPRTEP